MRFVLLHSPLLGPLSWTAAADQLRALGHTAETPAWSRLGDLDGRFYSGLAEGLAARIGDGEPPVLVAHSGAGPLVPALVAAMGAPRLSVVFVDSLLPHPGKRWFDTAPEEFAAQLRNNAQFGLLPSWDQWWPPGALERLVPDGATREALVAELEPIPLAYFEEPAPEIGVAVPTAYIQMSGAYETEAKAAGRLGWPLVSLPLHHLGMLTHPEAVARALEALGGRVHG